MASRYCYTKKCIAERKNWVNQQRDKPCSRCGNKFPYYVMDFHHLDRSTKSFAVCRGSYRNSRQRIEKEIAKCILLCANCHRIVEFESKIAGRLGAH